jgi:hypothetical protein
MRSPMGVSLPAGVLLGFFAPWIAGILFGLTGTYGVTLLVAASLASVSGGMSLLLARKLFPIQP